MKKTGKSGQMLLITIFVLTVAITIALALIGRSASDVGMSAQLEESARAFSAAEAGIEDALQTNTQTASAVYVSKDAAYTTVIAGIGSGSDSYTFPSFARKGDVSTIWLVNRTAEGGLDENPASPNYCSGLGTCTIDVCWDEASVIPATEVVVYYKNTSTGLYDLVRYALDPDPARTGNKFDRVTETSGCGEESGIYKKSIDLPTTSALPLFIRLRPYYANASYSVAATDGRLLPVQYTEVSSVGKTSSGVTRKIVVKKEYDSMPSLFDYTLYSEEDIKHDLYD